MQGGEEEIIGDMIISNRKKRVVLYGVDDIEIRRAIEFFMDDSYVIIGCSDHRYKFDIIDVEKGKVFIPPEKIVEADADYVLIAMGNKSAIQESYDVLVNNGVGKAQIVTALAPPP